jgi:tRNA(fMet)-specific endonuclease VapC
LRARNLSLVQRATAYLSRYGRADLSLVTRYEALRGWKARNATRKVAAFETFWRQNNVLLVTEDIIDRAADVWGELRRSGQPIGDIDPIIAATALHHGLALATRNVAHFRRIPGLTIDDWTTP